MNYCNYNIFGTISNKLINELTDDYGWEYIDVYMFPQTWSGTDCGFGGISGRALTKATTIVVISNKNNRAAVYINGKLAYKIKNINSMFGHDLSKHCMLGSAKYSGQYETTL